VAGCCQCGDGPSGSCATQLIQRVASGEQAGEPAMASLPSSRQALQCEQTRIRIEVKPKRITKSANTDVTLIP
jgi:hypothetical protein